MLIKKPRERWGVSFRVCRNGFRCLVAVSFPRILVYDNEIPFCLQQQKRIRKSAVQQKRPAGTLCFSEIKGVKETRYAQTTFTLIHYFLQYSSLLNGVLVLDLTE